MERRGFFRNMEQSNAPPKTSYSIPLCGACKLLDECKNPKMPVWGEGHKKILLVGEAPGLLESKQGRPFVGKSGQLLRRSLAKCGIDLDIACWSTNALICHPKNNKIDDRRKIDYCRPNLLNSIKALNPEVIILLGKSAVRSLISWLWKDTDEIERWSGWEIPVQRDGIGREFNSWVVPTYHPSYVMREEHPVLSMYFDEHIKKGVKLAGTRPWNKIPDWKNEVKIILDPIDVSRIIKEMEQRGKPIAWDIETDRIKPDSKDSWIVSCGISDGITTIAYPWIKEAREATKNLLISDLPKISWNQKYEDRWMRSVEKIEVKNWIYDGMIGTHTLDNRKGICSLKFQSFVLLGQGSYNDHIEPYFQSEFPGTNSPNKIKMVNMNQLLLYNGLDALLTYKVAEKQMPKFGMSL